MTVIDKVAWLEIRNGKILSTRSRGRHKYYFPGGKREAGESDWDALSREIREELSVDLREDSLKLVGVFQAQADHHPEGVQVKMTCYEATFRGILKPANEIEEVVWLSYHDRDKVSPVDQVIFDWLKERKLLG
ncbi:NUDIX domain-containing protein [Telluribacter sp.]|jgi:8-oxo-dGTP pyrophosphatase MutT (NUDIX family)|uniref:NUDIX hydrolase n=1 Tax=Telluribacter sp. TaxID=1978767 RepID=UPI002E14D5EC|nr:NUDIX domain-containing protein [Telluribacter sp.]